MEDGSPQNIPTRRRAQSMVELALILPTFMFLTVGVVDLGRAFYESIAIQGAAEAGAQTPGPQPLPESSASVAPASASVPSTRERSRLSAGPTKTTATCFPLSRCSISAGYESLMKA